MDYNSEFDGYTPNDNSDVVDVVDDNDVVDIVDDDVVDEVNDVDSKPQMNVYTFPPLPGSIPVKPVALYSDTGREEEMVEHPSVDQDNTVLIPKTATREQLRQIANRLDIKTDLIPTLINLGYTQVDQGNNWLFTTDVIVPATNQNVDEATGQLVTIPTRKTDLDNLDMTAISNALPAETLNRVMDSQKTTATVQNRSRPVNSPPVNPLSAGIRPRARYTPSNPITTTVSTTAEPAVQAAPANVQTSTATAKATGVPITNVRSRFSTVPVSTPAPTTNAPTTGPFRRNVIVQQKQEQEQEQEQQEQEQEPQTTSRLSSVNRSFAGVGTVVRTAARAAVGGRGRGGTEGGGEAATTTTRTVGAPRKAFSTAITTTATPANTTATTTRTTLTPTTRNVRAASDVGGTYPDSVELPPDATGRTPDELRKIMTSLGLEIPPPKTHRTTMYKNIVVRLVNLGYQESQSGTNILFTSPQSGMSRPSTSATTTQAVTNGSGVRRANAVTSQMVTSQSQISLPGPDENVRVDKLTVAKKLPTLHGFDTINVSVQKRTELAPPFLGPFTLVEPWINLGYYPDEPHPGFEGLLIDETDNVYQYAVISNYENYWQAGKVFDNDVMGTTIQQQFFERRGRILHEKEANKNPVGPGKKPIAGFYDGKFVDSIEARVYYFGGYVNLVSQTAEYNNLYLDVIEDKKKVLLVGYDGRDIGEINIQNVEAAFLDLSQPFSYELVLACMLTGVFPLEVVPLYENKNMEIIQHNQDVITPEDVEGDDQFQYQEGDDQYQEEDEFQEGQ